MLGAVSETKLGEGIISTGLLPPLEQAVKTYKIRRFLWPD